MKNLSIIIVNWNAKHQLLDCLRSIELASKKDFALDKVIVVDNASTDQSIQLIESTNFSFPLQIIKNSTNQGFGVACNQGAKDSNSDYLLFLNPDTRLFENSLTVPIELMAKKESAGIGVMGIQLIAESDKIQRGCTTFPTMKNFIYSALGLNKIFPNFFTGHAMKYWAHDQNKVVAHVIGAFYLIRAKLFFKVGGFDPDYFVYFEDLDLSLRIFQSGFKSFYCVDAQAFHKGGGTSDKIKAIRLFYSLRSELIYIAKHFHKYQFCLLLFMILLVEPLTRTIFAVSKLSWSTLAETWRAYRMLYADLPNILKIFFKQ